MHSTVIIRTIVVIQNGVAVVVVVMVVNIKQHVANPFRCCVLLCFTSKTRKVTSDPYSCRAMARMVEVLPVPGGP
jgi:hypothetical protein